MFISAVEVCLITSLLDVSGPCIGYELYLGALITGLQSLLSHQELFNSTRTS